MHKTMMCLLAFVMSSFGAYAEDETNIVSDVTLSVTNVTFQQRYPWNGLVDISCEVLCSDPETNIALAVSAKDVLTRRSYSAKTIWLTSDVSATNQMQVKAGRYSMLWDMSADYPDLSARMVELEVGATVRTGKGGHNVLFPDVQVYDAGTDYFVGNSFFELGVTRYGALGSSSYAPTSGDFIFHPRDMRYISMVSLYDPRLTDFFLPAYQNERWILTGDSSTIASGSQCGGSSGVLNAEFEDHSSASMVDLTVVNECYSNVKVEHNITFSSANMGYLMRVRLTNNSGSEMRNVKYKRLCDPDHAAISRYTGSSSTDNYYYRDADGNTYMYAFGNCTGISETDPDKLHEAMIEYGENPYVMVGLAQPGYSVDAISSSSVTTRYNWHTYTDDTEMGLQFTVESLPAGGSVDLYYIGSIDKYVSADASNPFGGYGESYVGAKGISEPGRIDTTTGTRIVEGSDDISYSPAWGDGRSVTVKDNEAELLTATEAGAVEWTPAETGSHVLTHVSGDTTLEAAFIVLDTNVVVHASDIVANETWSADVVHLVRTSITVSDYARLTIEPGAVVKFFDGTGIRMTGGSYCYAYGAIFTHINDDTVGGDTMLDGDTTKPKVDAYKLEGSLYDDDDTQYRYAAPQELSSSIYYNTRLRGHRTYIANYDVTVMSGVTLTIGAGTVIKFASGRSLTVNSGATLDVQGKADDPVVFTSEKDDDWGGDTNEDGDRTVPQAGDWRYVYVSGTATLKHCQALYGAPSNETGIIEAGSGGTLEMEGCTVAHSAYDGVWNWGGTIRIKNTVFVDCGNAVCPYQGSTECANCVMAFGNFGFMDWSHWVGGLFKNCIFYGCGKNWSDTNSRLEFQSHSTVKNCCFYNPEGYTLRSCTKDGKDGCIYADPKFLDPEKGDFRVADDSPCVDAADGRGAPETDFWGRPRMNAPDAEKTGVADVDGIYPDIGIYEVDGTPATPLPDLAVASVSSYYSSTMCGYSLYVQYEVVNRGKTNFVGSVNDVCKFLGADEANLGVEKTSEGVRRTYSLEPGESQWVYGYFTVPYMTPGAWKLGIVVNANRDVYEQNLVNNAIWSESTIDVSLNTLSIGSSYVSLNGKSSVSYQLTGISAAGGVFRLKGPETLRIYGGVGSVPTAGGHDVEAIRLADGTWLLAVPAHADDEAVYVTVENTGSDYFWDYASVADGQALELCAVAPGSVANVGTATLVLTGIGFSEDMTVTVGGQPATAVTRTGPVQATVEVNASGLAVGDADVTVTKGAESVTLPAALSVYAPKAGAKLNAWLETPSNVRDGRVYAAYVCYENTGDSPMDLPLFTVSRTDGSTRLGLVASESLNAEKVFVGGISPSDPAGVLKPGEAGRIPVYFQPFGRYGLKLEHLSEPSGKKASGKFGPFGSAEAYRAAMKAAATRLNLRGRTTYDVQAFVDQALFERNGQPAAAVSGRLLDVRTREPIADAAIALVVAGGTTDGAVTAVTGADGYFQLAGLADGDYYFALDSGNALAAASTNLVKVVRQADLNGQDVYATPGGKVSGYVSAGGAVPAGGVQVALCDGTTGAELAVTKANGAGNFKFAGLADGTYRVAVAGVDGYIGTTLTNVTVSGAAKSVSVEVELALGGMITGTVTAEGEPVTNGAVRAILQDGRSVEATVGADGTYAFAGLDAATYALEYYSSEYEADRMEVDVVAGTQAEANFEARARAAFIATRTMGFDTLETRFIVDAASYTNAVAWKWDFDSDGTVDSTEKNPTWRYTSVGTNTVTLIVETDDGRTVTCVAKDYIKVGKGLETVYKSNAIVLHGNVHNAGTLAVTSVAEGSMTLTGSADIALRGAVIMGQYEGEWFVRRVRSVYGNATSGWTVYTDEAGLKDVYEQLTVAFSSKVVDAGELQEESAPGARRLRQEGWFDKEKTWEEGAYEFYAKTGIKPSLTTSKDFYVEYVETICDGKECVQCAVVGSVGAQLGIEVYGEVGVNWSKTYPIPVKLVVPLATPIPVTLSPDFSVKLSAGINGKLAGEAHASVGAMLRVGGELVGDKWTWYKPVTFNTDAGCSWDLEASGSFGITFSPGVKARICGVTSVVIAPEFTTEFVLTGSLRAPATFESKFKTGLRAELNIVDLGPLGKVGVAPTIGLSENSLFKWTGPEPDFSYSPSSNLEAPATVTFTNKSKGDRVELPHFHREYRPKAYEWDLGVGTSSAMNPTATYPSEGHYNVYLKAIGNIITGPYRKKAVVTVGKPEEIPDDGDKETDDTGDGQSRQSCDPNEVVGPDGSGAKRYVMPGAWMDYTIYFENKSGFDIADAQEVWVTNPLNEWLDPTTVEIGEINVNNTSDLGLSGSNGGVSEVQLSGTNKNVRTEVAVEDGAIKWYLRVVDPEAADNFYWPKDGSGFLPSNDETHRGEGYLTYRVKVRDDVPMGVVITNSATIVFDYNDPIETDPAWWNTVAAKLPAEFAESAVGAAEGESIVLKVSGGNSLNPASVVLDVAYQTAAAADLDLKNVKVDGEIVKSFKFPYTLTWAVDEIGEKTVEIPVKADKTVEADETLTFTLANAAGQELGERHVCAATIVDTNEKALKASVKEPKDETLPKRSVSVERSNARGGFVAGTGEYASGSKLTLAAEARPGWEFRGWSVNGEIVSTTAKQQVDVTNDVRYVAVFARIPYVRGLAEPADAGTVSGSGYVASGKKVTLKATAAKNCTFAGWYAAKADDPNVVDKSARVATTASLVIDRSAKPAKSSKTTTVLTDIDGDVTYFAVFASSPVVTLAVDSSVGNAAAGKVTGAGRYAVKGKVTLKATAAKGYVFMGWYEGEALVSNLASYSFNMPAKDVFYVAKFITADEDKAAIAATVNGVGFDAAHTTASAETTCGVYLEWPVAPEALSATTVKVSGLPSGLKFTAKDILKKGSKTEVEIPANTIYGAPSAASKTDKGGKVTPSQVKVTVTTAGKNAQTFVIPLTVRALPAWAVGTFNGWSAYNGEGSGTLTVSAAGKLSGKTIVKVGTKSVTTSYSAAYFSAFEDDVLTAVLTFKSGKETLTETVRLSAYACGDAELGHVTEADDSQPIALELVQNPWLRKDKEVTPPAFPKAGLTCDLTGAFEGVKLTVKAKGAVTASGTLAGAKFSASAQLLLAEGDGTAAYVILNGEKVELALTLDDKGVVTAVVTK